MKHISLPSVSIVCLVSIFVMCQDPISVTMKSVNNLEMVITSEFRKQCLPGLAYAAIKGDSVVYSGGKGFADIKKQQTVY